MQGINISSLRRQLLPGLLSLVLFMAVFQQSFATSVPPEAVIAYLYSQPIGFTEVELGQYLRSEQSFISNSTVNELRLNKPTDPSSGAPWFLVHGMDSVPFTSAKLIDGGDYFLFDTTGGFDGWIMAQFPDLVVPAAEGNALKLYSYETVKKSGDKGFKLEPVLQQLGIVGEGGEASDLGNLESFRDALGSSIVAWMLTKSKTSVVRIENGRFKAIPKASVIDLAAGEGILAAKYVEEKFKIPVPPRTNYLWLFLGMAAGGGIMGLIVLVIGKGKKGKGDEALADEAGKVKDHLDSNDGKSEKSDEEEVKDKLKTAFDGEDAENLEKLRQKPDEEEEKSALAALMETLTGVDEEDDAAISAKDAGLRTLQQVLNTVAIEMKDQGSEEGHDYMLEFRSRLSDWIPAIEGLRLMAEENDPRRALERTRDIRKEMEADEDLTVLPLKDSQAVRDLKTVLDRHAELRESLQKPDPAREFLDALYERYGELTSMLGAKKELKAEDRAELMTRIVKMVLHLNDFMRIYLNKQHSDTTKINPKMLVNGGSIERLPSTEYFTFTESKTEIPLAVRNFRDLAREAGVTNLDDVLVEGYHIQPDALEK